MIEQQQQQQKEYLYNQQKMCNTRIYYLIRFIRTNEHGCKLISHNMFYCLQFYLLLIKVSICLFIKFIYWTR